jgi:G patch domain-containing protein 1
LNRKSQSSVLVREAANSGQMNHQYDSEAVKEFEEFGHNTNEFSPEDIKFAKFKSKSDLHGLGYTGLKDTNVLSQNYGTITSTLKTSRKSKGIRGQVFFCDLLRVKFGSTKQAFGVGAYEDDDEDIYTNYDLSQYDFEIGATTAANLDVPKCKKLSYVILNSSFYGRLSFS